MNLKINNISFRNDKPSILKSMVPSSQTPSSQDNVKADDKYKPVKIGGIILAGLAVIGGVIKILKGKSFNAKNAKHLATGLCKKFPELDIFSNTEKKMFEEISEKMHLKARKAHIDGMLDTSLLDIDYYKDNFLLNVINHTKSLKVFRETKNPKLKEAFLEAPQIFGVHDGIMIHGSNRPEKKELFNYFLKQAKQHDFEVVHINSHNRAPGELQTEFGTAMKAGKEKFLKEQRHTMIVFEDVDELLTEYVGNKKVNFLTGVWNKNVINCGRDGVMTLTTAGDIEKFCPPCIRGGRVTHLINIDTALARQVEADAVKNL